MVLNISEDVFGLLSKIASETGQTVEVAAERLLSRAVFDEHHRTHMILDSDEEGHLIQLPKQCGSPDCYVR